MPCYAMLCYAKAGCCLSWQDSLLASATLCGDTACGKQCLAVTPLEPVHSMLPAPAATSCCPARALAARQWLLTCSSRPPRCVWHPCSSQGGWRGVYSRPASAEAPNTSCTTRGCTGLPWVVPARTFASCLQTHTHMHVVVSGWLMRLPCCRQGTVGVQARPPYQGGGRVVQESTAAAAGPTDDAPAVLLSISWCAELTRA